eukprot:TRINITY_DN2997_c0_g2_i4.p1 TRINITY_DN2997_c0_g2~~TRINITY_DN2997_c0_g2_i4.p1  ORF type:complete len:394 (+),score=59.35 TRINITY_DN2997_c0_g2_i4:113-1183(+)
MGSSEDEEIVVIAAAAVTAAAAAYYYLKHRTKELDDDDDDEDADSEPTGRMFVNEVLSGRNSFCRDMFRMDKRLFRKLCDILRRKRLLRDTLEVRIEEQLAIFLLTIGHNERNRVVQERFHHSGETISRHFNKVLNAIVALAPDFFQPPDGATPAEITSKLGKFYPYFEYVLAGWEGSSSGQRILNSALTREDSLHIPEGKYYLVDASYTNMMGFLTPYDGVRYHLSEFTSGHEPENANELFNYRHSLLRSTVERTFGALKTRFPILKLAPTYSFEKQIKIVIATCVIHNFIRREKKNDWIFQMYDLDTPPQLEDPLVQLDAEASELASQWIGGEIALQIRDKIRDAMWRDHKMSR